MQGAIGQGMEVGFQCFDGAGPIMLLQAGDDAQVLVARDAQRSPNDGALTTPRNRLLWVGAAGTFDGFTALWTY